VVTFPEAALARFPFEDELHAEVDVEGLATPLELEDLRRTAMELVGARRLSGLPGVRLRLESASSFLRYDRAEGARLGAGIVWTPSPTTRLELDAGYPLARERASGGVAAEAPLGPSLTVRAELFHERMRDMGPPSGVAGAVNTLHAALAEIDYLDPYFTSGGRLRLAAPVGEAWRLTGDLLVERHRTARLEVGLRDTTLVTVGGDSSDEGFRPVRQILPGTLGELSLTALRTPPAAGAHAWSADATVALGTWDGDLYVRPDLQLESEIVVWERRDGALVLRSGAGIALGDAPPQRMFLIGGRGTVPGWPYRSFGGDRYWSAGAELGAEVAGPWVRARLLAYAGWAAEGGGSLPADWETAPTEGVRASLGAGLGLVHDVLRIDFARGLDGGEWQTLVSIRPRLRDFL